MKAYQHLLVAIDFSPSCRNALREALRLTQALNGTLTAVHVMDEFLVHELKRALALDHAGVLAEWRERLTKFVHENNPGEVPVSLEVRVGHPFTELAEACHVWQTELLIMGAKGTRQKPGRVGAIAAKCVRKAPADVLLVREDALGPFQRLVSCVDFSDNSGRALQRALQIARLDQVPLDAVHVFPSAIAISLDYGGLMAPLPFSSNDEQTFALWQKELETFVTPFQTEFPEVPVTSLIKERINVREAILDHVQEVHADLVVLGTRGKSGLREFLIGTTAEKIVANAACSILAVKPESVATKEQE